MGFTTPFLEAKGPFCEKKNYHFKFLMSSSKMSTRVYVGGLNHRSREKDIERFFRKFGRIREISLKKNGFCFVEFDDYRDADDACYEMNGRDLLGERVSVEIARGTPHGRDREKWGGSSSGSRDRRDGDRRGGSGRSGGGGGGRDGRDRPVWLDKYGPPTRTDYRVVVENLSSRVSWQDLKDNMRQAGEVTYADAHKPRRNEGCVEFASERDMKTALDKLDGAELNGRRIKLTEESKLRGRRSRSGGSRSRSRSRGGSDKGGRSKSRSRSRSPPPKDRSRSRSRSPSPKRDRSRSRSGDRADKDKNGGDRESRDRSRSRSRSRDGGSRSRSRSGSPKND